MGRRSQEVLFGENSDSTPLFSYFFYGEKKKIWPKGAMADLAKG